MPTFTVERLSFQHLAALPNAWQNADYLALLTQLDYDNPEAIAPAELKEMCQLALTDLEPTAAAEIVLGYLAGEQLTEGQTSQLAHQMETEKLWEENPKLELHQHFFNATQLLYDAYNGKFPHPQAVEFKVKSPPPHRPTWLCSTTSRPQRCCACWPRACRTAPCCTACLATS